MKKICRYCGGNLYFLRKVDSLGRPQLALICKRIECGRHNQFCSVKNAHYYEDRTNKIIENNMQEIMIHSCNECGFFLPSLICSFTGENIKHKKITCSFYKNKAE